ncbi:plasmid mobilization protein, partial [Bacteroides fragilis]|uniref:plasmid mobilization protein n=2 Tax=Bacteroides TaxID=816 RepID=UPI003F211C68
MTEDNKQDTSFSSGGSRTEYIGAKVTVEQKRHIRRLAAECGMTVSSYVLARAFNYRPKARLTTRQEAVMETLIGCRSDLVNYTSALRGMNPEKRRQMFNSYPFMLEWLKEL